MGIIDEVKSILKTIQQIDNIDLYRNILNLQPQIIELIEKNSNLKAEIKSLNEKFAIKEKLMFHNDSYWLQNSIDKENGPYCSKCWDTEQKLVRMIFCNDKAYSECPTCKKAIKIPR